MNPFFKRALIAMVVAIYPFATTMSLASLVSPAESIESNTINLGAFYDGEYNSQNPAFSMFSPQETTPADPLNILQMIPAKQYLGPVSFNSRYDTLLGMIFGTQYTQKVNEETALGFLGEYGPNQYRLNGTIGYEILPDSQVKFSGEYLSQVLPFEFDSGNINQRVGQWAYGLSLRHNFHESFFRDVNLNSYWSKAPNVSLSDQVFSVDDILYTNERNLAGATAEGVDVGTDINVGSKTLLGGKLYYDKVDYHTEFTSDSDYNNSGIGGSLQIDQILNDRLKLSLLGEARALYNSYGGSISFVPGFFNPLGLHVDLFAKRLLLNNETPDSNSYGIQVKFLSEDGEQSPKYHLSNATDFGDIGAWVENPAVYMERVLSIAEQETTINAPMVSQLTPSSGPITGGNTVIINGTNFLPGVTVTFNGTPGTVTLLSSSELSVIVPALTFEGPPMLKETTTEPVDVVVTNTDGQKTVLSASYTYTSTISITGISPNNGSTAGGTVVTITGTNFVSGTTTVQFGTQAGINVTVNSPTSLTVQSPSGSAGAVDVSVTTGTDTATSTGGFTYLGAPTVTAFTPLTGSTSGGTSVTVTGTNFVTGATTVAFGPNQGTSVVVTSSTSLTVTTPANTAGTVALTVTTASGQATAARTFRYVVPPTITAINPNSGSSAGGTRVTISGTGLNSVGVAAKFGSNAATDVAVIAGGINARVPASTTGTGAVDVTVTTGGGSAVLAGGFTYITGSAPTIVSASPSTGPLAGNTLVTITGTNFVPGSTTVKFGSNSVTSMGAVTSTSLLAITPAASVASTVDITVTTPDGSAVLAGGFTYN